MTTTTPSLGDLIEKSEGITIDAAVDQSRPPALECLCPFCGEFNSGVGKPCASCTLEDSKAARAATARRVGPWFVLQSRNPEAPGMDFAALQSLVCQQIVTPRSVVRGPTTGQLWRLASKVRGLSREFGQCYDCGEDIERDDAVCPHCERLQTLPETTGRPVSILGGSTAAPGIAERQPSSEKEIESAPTSQSEPSTGITEPATAASTTTTTTTTADTLMDAAECADPEPINVMSSESEDEPSHESVNEHAMDRPAPKDDLLTARDVAKAFLLEFGPTPVIEHKRPFFRSTHFDYRKLKTGLSLVAVLVTAALLWPIGQVVIGWFESNRSVAVTPAGDAPAGTADARIAAALMLPSPKEKPADTNLSGGASAKNLNPQNAETGPRPEGIKWAKAVTRAEPTPAQSPVIRPVVRTIEQPAVIRVEHPVLFVSTPPSPPTPTPAAEPVPTPSPLDDPEMLWNIGMDAESHQDFRTAVQAYERLESLPSDSWPKHLQVRLELARKELTGECR